jgi:hypothetical protein
MFILTKTSSSQDAYNEALQKKITNMQEDNMQN